MNLQQRINRLERMRPVDPEIFQAMVRAISDVDEHGNKRHPLTVEVGDNWQPRPGVRRSWLFRGLTTREMIEMDLAGQPAPPSEQPPAAKPADPLDVLPLVDGLRESPTEEVDYDD